MTSGRSAVKRLVDVVASSLLLTITAPISVAVALAVRARLGGPVLFRQERAGLHGHPIEVFKFRTMSDERDERGELLPDEQRLGPFGMKLRSTSLDELPQLWSIMRGDMSFVGPRPLPMRYVERYSARQRRRLEVTPGLTGWAQVNGRNALAWPERLELDVWYVENWSLSVDARILRDTVGVVLGRSGVAADGEVTMREFTGES